MKSSPMTAALCMMMLAGCGEEAAQTAAMDDVAPATYGGSPQTPAQKPDAPAASRQEATQTERSARTQKPDQTQKASPGQPIGSRTLSYPEDLQMIMLSYRLRGETPPFEKWAKEANSVRMANEFNRSTALEEEMDRLRDAYDSIAEVGVIQLRTISQFSEYDGNQGGYYLSAFAPGTTYSFDAYREKAALQITNAGAAYLWPLDAQAAQDVLQKNVNMRSVTIDATLVLTGMERRSSGPHLTAELREYSILSNTYGREALLDQRSLK